MRKIALILVVLILVIVSALVMRVEFQSPRQPKVSIIFHGYTNDSTGSQLARFTVSNSEASAVQVWPPFILALTPTGEELHSVPGITVLGAHASMMLIVPPPTNQTPWRIYLRVDPDVGAYRNIKHFLVYRLLSVGLRPRYRTMPYGVFSDWIESKR